jgi:hypothetical protein
MQEHVTQGNLTSHMSHMYEHKHVHNYTGLFLQTFFLSEQLAVACSLL